MVWWSKAAPGDFDVAWPAHEQNQILHDDAITDVSGYYGFMMHRNRALQFRWLRAFKSPRLKQLKEPFRAAPRKCLFIYMFISGMLISQFQEAKA
jgi:hypothetical protein